MNLLARLNAYTAHDDPATRVANIVAMVIGWNGPFYPVYMVALLGWQVGWMSLLTTLAAPLFLAIPFISRRSSVAGRVMLLVVGAANTAWCLKLLGQDSGIDFFFIPCVVLAVLLHHRRETAIFLIGLAVPLLLNFIPAKVWGAALIPLASEQASSIRALNESSVICLMAFIAFQLSNLLDKKGD